MITFNGKSIHLGWVFFKLIGLTIGLTVSLTIFSFVIGELSSEHWLEDSENIVLVTIDSYEENNARRIGKMPYKMGAALDHRYDDVDAMGRLHSHLMPVAVGRRTETIGVAFIDEGFFDVIKLKNRDGNIYAGPSAPDKISVTAQFAREWYGSENVIGEKLEVSHQVGLKTYTIESVIQDFPGQSHLSVHNIFVFAQKSDFTATNYLFDLYVNTDFATYLRLKEDVELPALETDMAQIGQGFQDRSVLKSGIFFDKRDRFKLVRLNSLARSGLQTPIQGIELSNGRELITLFLIGCSVLLLAIFNYVMMAIVDVEKATRVIGIKKILGASNRVTIKPIFFEFEGGFRKILNNPIALLTTFFVTMIAIIIAGTLPAYFTLKVNPVYVLSGILRRSFAHKLLRRLLVLTQIAITAAMLLIASVMGAQTEYLQARPVGFNNENLVILDDPGKDALWISNFRNRIDRELPGTTHTVAGLRASTWLQGLPARYDRIDGTGDVLISQAGVEANFFDVIGSELLAGRTFYYENSQREISSGDTPIIINTTLLNALGFSNPQEVIDHRVEKKPHKAGFESRFPPRDEIIIGVVNDIQMQGRNKISPPVSYVEGGYPTSLFLRLPEKNDIEAVRQIVRETSSEPLEVKFFSEVYAKAYASEKLELKRVTIASLFCIFLSALGIFGLITQNALSERKTLALKYVMGAGIRSLVAHLLKPISVLTVLGMILGFAISTLYLIKWLSNYVYQIPLSPLRYLNPISIIIFVVVVCVTWPIASAVFRNPIYNLRQE